jgi:hypothetical protein
VLPSVPDDPDDPVTPEDPDDPEVPEVPESPVLAKVATNSESFSKLFNDELRYETLT